MKFVDNLRQKPFVQKVEKFFPAIAFLGGFGWDSITLGRQIDNTDLLFLLAYYTGAFILVILLSAHLEHPEGWTRERIMAAKASTGGNAPAKPAAPQTAAPAKPAAQPATAKQPAVQEAKAPSPTNAKLAAVAGKMANIAKPATTVVASKIKNVADASATKIKNAADASTAEAKKLADKIDTTKMNTPSFMIVLTAVGTYAYQRKDGVFVVPIGCLKD